ncbi:uncharacterized protein K452DRAFT_314035 [Aplosporella prunicola CBS 121167]|uniref:DUF7626 domain-containing protein n=1 Tax=Aplosporella prunicola CBS 121167 TaxID=1176127 RepID=A0A6A6AUV1_9PEZI|nr:uncharacterized protein K452DRAFT_314035 [Aplosporella prunicola CBS 121167]KAF2135376.1 hypothetical protein K452DRAFT_314035 [Aplosporella prunicola CBS 121167]
MSGYGQITHINPGTNLLPYNNRFNVHAGIMSDDDDDVQMDYDEDFDPGALSDAESEDMYERPIDANAGVQAQSDEDFHDLDADGSLFVSPEDPYQQPETHASLAGQIAFGRQPTKSRRAVTTNLDVIDKTIFDLKASGFGDKHIAGVIEHTFNLKYDAKSIVTRYRRICQVKMNEKDRQLENYQAFWTSEEDEAMLAAYHAAQLKVEAEVEAIRARVFHKTATELHRTMPSAFYSPAACEQRFEQLKNGAVAPVDLNELPTEERAAEAALRLERINLKGVILQQKRDYKAQSEIIKELTVAHKAHKANMATTQNTIKKTTKKKKGKK